jgi:hypothetical protein
MTMISTAATGSEDDIQTLWVGHPILVHVDDQITRESTIAGKPDWTVPICRVAWVEDGQPVMRSVEIRGSLGRKILARWGQDHQQHADHWVLLYIVGLGSAQTAYRGWTTSPASPDAKAEADMLSRALEMLLDGDRPDQASAARQQLRTIGLGAWGQR